MTLGNVYEPLKLKKKSWKKVFFVAENALIRIEKSAKGTEFLPQAQIFESLFL